jgi:hypothetical protein
LLSYYKTLKPSEQSNLAIDIITDIERYRGLLEVMKERGDMEFYNKHKSDLQLLSTKCLNVLVEIWSN